MLLSLLREVLDNKEFISPLFSKGNPEELHELYCQKLFENFGSFHPVENPASKVFDKIEYYTYVDTCNICDVEAVCTVHAATRTSKVFLICKPCIQDFNMHVFNPDNKDYCRSLKQKR